MSKVVELRREQPDNNDRHSRVDFYIEMADELPYLIEVKINNQNHHFGQYEAAYNVPSNRLGYIVNYNLTKEGYDVKTWKQFYDYLSAAIDIDAESKELIDGYLSFLQNVCISS